MKKVKRLAMQALAILASVCFLASCSGKGYTNAIPQNANAVLQIDFSKVNGQQELPISKETVKLLFPADNAEDCGIDFKHKIFLFTTVDGNMGLCAKTDDKEKITELLEKMAKSGESSRPVERRGYTFALINNSWAVGISDEATTVMGPILPAQMADATRTLTKWLKQDEEHSATETPLFDLLKEKEEAAVLAARGDALPQQLAALLTITKPKDTDNSDIYITATLEKKDNTFLNICAETTASNENLKNSLDGQSKKMRPIGKRFLDCAPADALCSIFTNMQGTDFLDMIHASKELGVMLAGANTVVDMDNILRSVDGNMLTSIKSYSADSPSLSIAAKLKDSNFLKDIEYWKKSCGAGASLETLSPNTFAYKSGNTNFWFGISKEKEFYGSTEQTLAPGILSKAAQPLPTSILTNAEGKRFAVVINIKELLGLSNENATAKSVAEPLLGGIQYILYTIK